MYCDEICIIPYPCTNTRVDEESHEKAQMSEKSFHSGKEEMFLKWVHIFIRPWIVLVVSSGRHV